MLLFGVVAWTVRPHQPAGGVGVWLL